MNKNATALDRLEWLKDRAGRWRVPLFGAAMLLLVMVLYTCHRRRQRRRQKREEDQAKSMVTVRDGQVETYKKTIKVKRKASEMPQKKHSVIYRYQEYQAAAEAVKQKPPRNVRLTIDNVQMDCRVERGEHWKKGDQDGGVGSCGTVRAFTKEDGYLVAPARLKQKLPAFPALTACVLWDSGKSAFYPMGNKNEYALALIEEEAPNKSRSQSHTNTRTEYLDHRKASVLGDSRKQSVLERFRAQQQQRQKQNKLKVKSRSNSMKTTAITYENLEIGCRVCRSEHWGAGDQDGGVGNLGSIIAIKYSASSKLQAVASNHGILQRLQPLPDGDFVLVEWDAAVEEEAHSGQKNQKKKKKAFVYPFQKVALVSCRAAAPVGADALEGVLEEEVQEEMEEEVQEQVHEGHGGAGDVHMAGDRRGDRSSRSNTSDRSNRSNRSSTGSTMKAKSRSQEAGAKVHTQQQGEEEGQEAACEYEHKRSAKATRTKAKATSSVRDQQAGGGMGEYAQDDDYAYRSCSHHYVGGSNEEAYEPDNEQQQTAWEEGEWQDYNYDDRQDY